MFLVALFLLGACSELVSGESEISTLVEGKRPDSKDSILDTCQALKDDAQVIRNEGYSAIDKADMIREQAYRVKDEAYDIKDDAYEIKESALEARSALETTLVETLDLMNALEARSALETTLVETLDLMKSQATGTNLYMQEIRTSLNSVMTRMDRLEQGLEDIEQGLRDVENELEEIEQGQEQIEQALAETRASGCGEWIPAIRVAQSTTYDFQYSPAEKAVDGNLNTGSHTKCGLPRPWFRYFFSEPRAIGRIKVVNGKLNVNKYRLNGAKVFVMVGEGNKRPCRVNTITVREGDSLEAQTYNLDCTGNIGIGVEFVLESTNCLEFMEIEVYAP